MKLQKLLKNSRPRFWIYILGPYLLGIALLYPSISNTWLAIAFGLYFTFPANLLIYGINDIFDYETDKLNPKKETYEDKIEPSQRKYFYLAIAVTNIPFFLLLVLTPISAIYSFAAFLFFSIFYSAKPIRAKTKPFLDSLFNILYIFPGFFAYFLAGGANFSLSIFLAGTFWVMAMHAYSAIPDIKADKESGINTIATKLGAKNTLWFCLFLYVLSATFSYFYLGYLNIILGTAYILMIIISFKKLKRDQLFKVYKFFPIVNTLVGFFIFLYVLIM